MRAYSDSDNGSLHSSTAWWRCILVMLLALPLSSRAQTIPLQDLDRLQGQLQRFGWQTARGVDGDLIIRPPLGESIPPPEGTGSTSSSGPPGPIPATDIRLLASRLQDHGWSVEQDSTGALLVYPGGATAPDVGAVAGRVPPQSGNEALGDDLYDLHALLEASGWRVSRDAAGDLIVAPGEKKTSPEQHATVSVNRSDLADAREVLTAAGWRLNEIHDGSLLLYPAKAPEDSAAAGAAKPGGRTVPPLVGNEVRTPIDSPEEARTLAEYWLRQQGLDDRLVGRIRKVNWIYLVSIVGQEAPHRLHDQIAIRINDGMIVPLFQ